MSGATTARPEVHRTLLAALIATVGMLFAAFAAAFLEQRASGTDWQVLELPGLVWINTAILVLSSVVLEWARRKGSRAGVWVTLGLGLLFVAGQLALWANLRARGIYLPTSRYGSFVYILTGLHAIHLLAALVALLYGLAHPHVMRFITGFWHFLGVVWLYVLGVLLVL